MDLLVAIAIIGVLLTISIPALMAARGSARRETCRNKVRQFGVAMASFESSHGHFPSGKTTLSQTQDQFSWSAQLLPFMEQGVLWDRLKRDDDESEPDDAYGGGVVAGLATLLPAVQCPSSPTTETLQRASNLNGTFVGLSDYLAVAGKNYLSKDGVFFLNSKLRTSQISDGLSNTLFVGERPPSVDNNFGWWFSGGGQDGSGNVGLFLGMEEVNSGQSKTLEGLAAGPYRYKNGDPQAMESVFHFWSHHAGGANFLLGDGSVQFLSYETDRGVMLEMSAVR
jgi:prepilin-type processing-associated H-X9-DG protein